MAFYENTRVLHCRRSRRPHWGALTGAASAAAIAAAMGAGAAAFAQDGQVEIDAGAERDTIIVSARRREETLQDVPIAVTALSGEELAQAGAPDITFLNQVVPNVTIERSRSTNSTITAFIRGVGQQDPVAGFEQGVGIYIDDVYLNRPQGAVLDIYDVERVEVLRGPQGTLYGRNTIGGALKYVTKRLGDEPTFRLRASGGTYNQVDVVATFGVPITDDFKFGGTVAHFSRDGFGENLTQQGVENYNKDVIAGRASFEWTPADRFFFRLSGDWVQDNSDPRQGHRLVPGQATPGAYPILDNVFDTRADLDFPRDLEVVNRGVTLLAEFQLNDQLTLKNILAYRDNKSSQQIDFDSLPINDFQAPFVLEDDQFSEEFQILFDTDAVSGVAGFYYLTADAFNAFDSELGAFDLNGFVFGDVKTDTWSIFGDVTFDIADLFGWSGPLMHGFEISVGGRYTEDERSARVIRELYTAELSPFFGGDATFIARTSDFEGSDKFDDFTPRISVAWKPHPDHNAYFSWSQGFKGGGFDPRGQTTAAPDLNANGVGLSVNGVRDPEDEFNFLQFEPEEITTYEVGLKSVWNGGRASTNLALFYSDYTNVQIPGSVGVDSDNDGVDDGFSGATTNAGAATFIGVEFEGNAILAEDMAASGDSLVATGSVGWVDAEFDEFFVAVTDTGSGETAIENVGEFVNVQNTPEWTANVTTTYARPLSIYGAQGSIALINSGSYRGFTSQFEIPSPLIDQDGYFLYDASLVWTSDNGRWQIGIHGKNLTDKLYKVAGYDFFTGASAGIPGIATPILGVEGTLTAFYGDPRTVTGTVQVQF